MKNKIKVLFVCHGNICRSPAAQGAFEALIKEKKLEDFFEVDSAGVSSYHIGESPHPLTKKAAKEKGIVLNHYARQINRQDLDTFDYIFAMDRYNYQDLMGFAVTKEQKEKIFLFREFDPVVKDSNTIPDVPDPYYGDYEDFQTVQKIVSRTAENLLNYLLEKHSIIIK